MTQPLKVAMLLPDGVGYRNFVFGPFLREASREAKVTIFHLGANGSDLAKQHPDVSFQKMIPFPDRPRAYFLRQALIAAHMKRIGTFPMLAMLNRRTPGTLLRRVGVGTAKSLGKMWANDRGIQRLQSAHNREVDGWPEVRHYRKLFEKDRPDVVFSSNQTPLFVIAPVLAARQLGIPTATFIFSWDNLSSKGRIMAPFEHYLLWSDQMRQELHRYYPETPEGNSHVIGTPQFDPYADKSLLWSRVEFCKQVGADPLRPIICFSGGDAETCPADPLHVRILLQLIRDGKISGSPQVLLRPSPVDGGERYQPVLRDHPEAIFAPPKWTKGNTAYGDFYSVMPTSEDVQLLANLTHHCDMNVNLGSTMTLDFAIHDKPVVNIMIDEGVPPPFGGTMRGFVDCFEHYKPVIALGAVRVAETRQQLADHINAYLADPTLDREGRKRFMDLEVGAPIGASSGRILSTLRRLSNTQRSAGSCEPELVAR